MEDSFAMNGGVGSNSYFNNSRFQGEQLEKCKAWLCECILQHLTATSPDTGTRRRAFVIADLGCSVGPNTFYSVQTIIEAVKHKYNTLGFHESTIPEFLVFFNDQVMNDFNALFLTLPSSRPYSAAGVPGSFYGRLFPAASIDLMHSSFSIHWLSRVPPEVKTLNSPAWNKGRVTYAGASREVVEAYVSQFERDMAAFFTARSEEMVDGALLMILMPCRPEGTHPSDSKLIRGMECLGSALLDMGKEGLIDEELIDSFNLPLFIPTAAEVKKLVSQNIYLRIERLEKLYVELDEATPEFIGRYNKNLRSLTECLVSKHFGPSIVDLLYEKLPLKIANIYKPSTNDEKLHNLFVCIKKTAAGK